MQRTLTIAKREFRGYFNSPAAYIVICLFLLMMGFFFWNPFFLINRASVRNMYDLIGDSAVADCARADNGAFWQRRSARARSRSC